MKNEIQSESRFSSLSKSLDMCNIWRNTVTQSSNVLKYFLIIFLASETLFPF